MGISPVSKLFSSPFGASVRQFLDPCLHKLTLKFYWPRQFVFEWTRTHTQDFCCLAWGASALGKRRAWDFVIFWHLFTNISSKCAQMKSYESVSFTKGRASCRNNWALGTPFPYSFEFQQSTARIQRFCGHWRKKSNTSWSAGSSIM